MAQADFSEAVFQRNLLTDSSMPSANFRGAQLRGCPPAYGLLLMPLR